MQLIIIQLFIILNEWIDIFLNGINILPLVQTASNPWLSHAWKSHFLNSNWKSLEPSIIQMEKCKNNSEIQRKYTLGEGKEKRGDFEIRA